MCDGTKCAGHGVLYRGSAFDHEAVVSMRLASTIGISAMFLDGAPSANKNDYGYSAKRIFLSERATKIQKSANAIRFLGTQDAYMGRKVPQAGSANRHIERSVGFSIVSGLNSILAICLHHGVQTSPFYAQPRDVHMILSQHIAFYSYSGINNLMTSDDDKIDKCDPRRRTAAYVKLMVSVWQQRGISFRENYGHYP
jgi:hypothetical protein